MADELLASDTFDGRLTINARKSVEMNNEMEAVYRQHAARAYGRRAAITILDHDAADPDVQPRPAVHVSRLHRGVLAEGWCSGVPFSREDGSTTTYGNQLTTDALFTLAASTSTRRSRWPTRASSV